MGFLSIYQQMLSIKQGREFNGFIIEQNRTIRRDFSNFGPLTRRPQGFAGVPVPSAL